MEHCAAFLVEGRLFTLLDEILTGEHAQVGGLVRDLFTLAVGKRREEREFAQEIGSNHSFVPRGGGSGRRNFHTDPRSYPWHIFEKVVGSALLPKRSTASRASMSWATLHACAMHPRGACGGSPSKISASVPIA